VAHLPEGQVVFLPAGHRLQPGRPIVGAVLATSSLAALQEALQTAGIAAPAPVDTANGRSIFLPPGLAHGMWLEFREQK